MAEYDYKGCVTGFSESDTVTLWQPDDVPYSVEHDDNEYSARLVDVFLLESKLPSDMGLAKDYKGTGWYKAVDTGIVYNKDVPRGETHTFEGDPKEYISVHTKEDAAKYASRAATSNIERTDYLFDRNVDFNEDISHWDMSNINSMAGMFYGASNFNQSINNWDVSNVTNMEGMFTEAESFNQPLGNWDVSNVKNMRSIFTNAKSFSQDLSQWCVSKITKEPNPFAINAKLTPEQLPDWGTCPRGKNGT